MIPSSSSAPARRISIWLWLLPLLLLAALGAAIWHQARQRDADRRELQADADLRTQALEDRLAAIRRDQRAQLQRLQHAEATNRVLRDELLGVGQRAALLEESVSRLADPDRHGAQALRLDETELLLGMARHRLDVAGDLDGARRAYDLAAGVLQGVADPAYLSLRQTLMQERAALDALGRDPRAAALARLDEFAQRLESLPPVLRPEEAADRPWWDRAFGALIRVQPSDRALAVQSEDRATALAGLRLELSLARVAAERRDTAAYQAALARAGRWMERLWPYSHELRRRRADLQEIAALPLSPALPTLGSTLEQLRQLRGAR